MDEAQVDEALKLASERWPQLRIRREEFVRFAAARQRADPRYAADLVLAFACARGDETALMLFRERFEERVRGAAAKVLAPDAVDDAVQRVLTRLFVASDGGVPAILKYGGRGKLETWISVLARREASNLRREERPDRKVELRESDQLISYAASDVVLSSLKATYRGAFRAAFAEALAALSSEDRNLLRYECLDGLTRAQIARLRGVSTMTIARRRAALRVRLRTLTREAFGRQVGVAEDEVDSAIDLIGSHLEVSLSRLLREDDSE